MTGTIDRRLTQLERVADADNEKPVFIFEGEPIPAGTDPARIVHIGWAKAGEVTDIAFPPGFVWPALEQDLDALNTMQEKQHNESD